MCACVYTVKFQKSWYCTVPDRQKSKKKKKKKKKPFLFHLDMAPRPNIFAWGIPLYAYVLSFTKIAVVLAQFEYVQTENQTKVLRYLHFLNQNKIRLLKTGSDR